MIGPAFPQVLAAAAGGDERAFTRLWLDLQPPLLRYLRVLASPMAEDLAADTWLEVVRGLGRFSGDEPRFRSWIFLIARHRTVDWRRRAARQATEPVPVDALAHLEAPDDPAASALEAISGRSALALIATLTEDQAEVVTLRVVAGLDVAHVAEIVGKPPGTVRVLAHRGLRRLAERLGQDARSGRAV
ncbi:MAG TPA: RNA polymerase sigma factor [Actinomycetes bacterium]|nr:RNA polymerase sigma factor [Actinomycetes bacterium]